MNEYSFRIRKSLQQGLRPDSRVATNEPWLEDMRNLRPTEFGALSPENIRQIGGSVTGDRSLFRGERQTLLTTATGLYTLDSSLVPSATTIYGAVDANSTSSPTTINYASGPLVYFASFQDYWFMGGAGGFLFRLPSNDSGRVYTKADMVVRALCRHGNGLAIGGVTLPGSWFASTAWLNYFKRWRSRQQIGFVNDQQAADDTWVFYVRGEKDMDKDIPFYDFMAMLGVYGSTEEQQRRQIINTLIDNGQIGMFPARSVGTINGLSSDGKVITAYGNNGITRAAEVGASYETARIEETGIQNIGAVCAVGGSSVWADASGDLFRDGRRLGYSEFIGSSGNVRIHYDTVMQEHYVRIGDFTYILTPTGLGGPVTGSYYGMFRDATYGLVSDLSITSTLTSWRLQTTAFDNGERDSKKLVNAQAQFENVTVNTGKSRLLWRVVNSASYTTPAILKPYNPQGVCYLDTSYIDGKLYVQGTATKLSGGDVHGAARIHQIVCRYNQEGKRHRRGTAPAFGEENA